MYFCCLAPFLFFKPNVLSYKKQTNKQTQEPKQIFINCHFYNTIPNTKPEWVLHHNNKEYSEIHLTHLQYQAMVHFSIHT